MKISFLAILLTSILGLNAQANNVTKLTERPGDVFVPTGFDDNDNVQVVLSGSFGNTCFSVAPASIKRSGQKIYIKNQIYDVNHCAFGLMMIPYQKVLDLGVLPVGHYDVMVDNGKNVFEKRASFPVTASKDTPYTPDNALYAPVHEIDFKPGEGQADPTLSIRGALNNTCLSVVGITVNRAIGNVVTVLPITEMRSQTNCKVSATPYEKTVRLNGFPKGNTLLHVRSMGGQAINRVITFLDRFDVNFIGK